jgi:hypothetical protein
MTAGVRLTSQGILYTNGLDEISRTAIGQTASTTYAAEFDELGTDLIPLTTSSAQAYGSGSSSYFFRVYGPLHNNPPNANFDQIQLGWYVVGHPTWIVTSVVPDADDNNESCTITITGGSFIDVSFYGFTNGVSTAIARRENKNGRYQVSGYFDEYTGF